jgi:hypothetical protein
MVVLQAKQLGFHFVDTFDPLSTIQLQGFLFAWLFEIVIVR